jgi:hypothetical protein
MKIFWLLLKNAFIIISIGIITNIGYKLTIGYVPILPTIYEPVNPKLPGIPPVSQESIDIAVKSFKIKIPWNTFHPKLDKQMSRNILGLSYTNALLNYCVVTIGPQAFESWGQLGTTLAHEIEVHCNQNHVQAVWDTINNRSPITRLEREAYTYTLLSERRFYLTDREYMGILMVMEYHYPKIKEQ